MAVFGLKIAFALAMVNALIRLCYGQSAFGYCAARTCGATNDGVAVRFPFVLQADAVGGRCYTDYPSLAFECMDQVLYLNFTGNLSTSYDMYKVVNIDYVAQTLSLVPSVLEATCRLFDASRFGSLNITNTTTLLLNCPGDVHHDTCVMVPGSSDVCNGTAGNVNYSRWACQMVLNNFTDSNFSSCHLMDSLPAGLNMAGNATLELQFAGNSSLSFLSPLPSPSPAPALAPNGAVSQTSGKTNKNKQNLFIIFGVVIGSLVAIVSFLVCMVCWYKHIRSNSNMITKHFTQVNINKLKDYKTQSTTLYTLKELEKATKNFSDDFKLGAGGFGIVYKGTLDNGEEVAIKKTNRVDKKGSEQYMNEVLLLSQVNHRNLVRLHGCCLEVEVPMLVYEYVPNGDLFQHLQGERPGMQLTWTKRLQIAIDTAEALRYLHSAANPPIYHRDVKTSNILLDDKFNVKVADFGISRLVKLDATHVSTVAQGTPGYLDPEYFQNFQLTDKSDVYSFGMVLLELITSLKPVDFQREAEDVNLKTMAMPFIQMGNMEAIADIRLFNKDTSESYKILEEMQRVAELASKCLASYRRHRPSMKEVVIELVAIKGIDGSENAGEIYNMDHEEVEMDLVVENLSLNLTSNSESSSIKNLKSFNIF